MKISFIGGGNMAAALIGGLVHQLGKQVQIHVVDIHTETLQKLSDQWGVTTASEMDDTLRESEIIVLAVKPQQLKAVALQLAPYVQSQLVLSIAAGVYTDDLSRWLNGYKGIVRAMPNTPALLGKGMTGLVSMTGVTTLQRERATQVMEAVGQTLWLEAETQMDALTALSGSGPAYVFYFMEAIQKAAVEMGLTPEQGKQLVMATFEGASVLATQSNEPTSVLREQVTSKGGVTYAAMTVLIDRKVKAAVMDAVYAAAARSRAMGEELGERTRP